MTFLAKYITFAMYLDLLSRYIVKSSYVSKKIKITYNLEPDGVVNKEIYLTRIRTHNTN